MDNHSKKIPTWTGWEGWTLRSLLGSGGNGDVWEAEGPDSRRCAIKFLHNIDPKRYARFKAEVQVLSRLHDQPGILPVLQSYLPETLAKKDPPWYAMPLAEPAVRKLRGGDGLTAVAAMVSIARCVAALHEQKIVHRDIKPENILFYRGSWCLGDFGLVDFEGRSPLTRDDEMVGPRWTIAPEMRRVAGDADGQAADVYSMAKTTWMFLTGDLRGFDGQYDRRSPRMSLSEYIKGSYMRPLYALLEDATQYDPERRPSAAAFANRLTEWLEAHDDFDRRCSVEWSHIQRWLFPNARPARAEWRDLHAIAAVLQELSETQNVNHCFFASSGGLDLDSCAVRADGTLLLDFNGIAHIVKPSVLEAHLWYDHPEWSYFWLEFAPMVPLYAGKESDAEFVEEETDEDLQRLKSEHSREEHVLSLPDGRLLPINVLEQGFYVTEDGEDAPIPEGCRRITRMWGGPIAIFSKASPYNKNPAAYDAPHAKMGRDRFQHFITHLANMWDKNFNAGAGNR